MLLLHCGIKAMKSMQNENSKKDTLTNINNNNNTRGIRPPRTGVTEG